MLFDGVRFFVSQAIPNAADLTRTLKEHGGERQASPIFLSYSRQCIPFLSLTPTPRTPTQFGMDAMVTHVVVGPDDPEPGELGPDAAVVTPAWVEWSVKFGCTPPIGTFTAAGIFRGAVVATAGASIEDQQKLWALVSSNGGEFLWKFTPKCTHLLVVSHESVSSHRMANAPSTPSLSVWCVGEQSVEGDHRR
jgi:hypothetical protein